ncbi:MAG: 4-hydroxy-3-methylbut-2-enyl diphosphate reductase [Verrucomicrobiaceae bacterium]|nr:MAG: 4-hydroxy-3-methylbut-2-enyl diphosphate reductase [Verrucomicrobiaceae bacterium]
MSTPPVPAAKLRKVNVRTPEVMARVQEQVETHYRSTIVERVRQGGGIITVGNTTIRLARQFGFCYGVERAIDLAYAARKVFGDQRLFLLGEIIHNPEVNRQLSDMSILMLHNPPTEQEFEDLQPDDIVIIPAFGATTAIMQRINERGCRTVDTTCGDVMSVWRRVREYARRGLTSIIHGKAAHEETRATASRAQGDDGMGNYLIILTLSDADAVCDYIRHGGEKEAFLKRFHGAWSPGFDPDIHLRRIGVANQTTMLKSETEELQSRLRQAIIDRDGTDLALENFSVFDTICGATQERQDALYEMLKQPMDLLLVVGGYNSSNTTHLVEIAQEYLPTFFIKDSSCLKSLEEIVHFDLHSRHEQNTANYSSVLLGGGPVTIGITAGASCPNNLIEETILRLFSLRGIPAEQVLAA